MANNGAGADAVARKRKQGKQPSIPPPKVAKTTAAKSDTEAEPETPPPFEISWKNFALVKNHFGLSDEECALTLEGLLGPDPVLEAAKNEADGSKAPTIPPSGFDEERDDEEGEEEMQITDSEEEEPPRKHVSAATAQKEVAKATPPTKQEIQAQATPAKAGWVNLWLRAYMSK